MLPVLGARGLLKLLLRRSRRCGRLLRGARLL